ncbi:hypothetical protein B0H14DRAFT_3433252 [Mycena olivaceomarginata]|nr:hypothetical protein B0H14DRAFT_3433252 [Mycena olivaceomarginata]
MALRAICVFYVTPRTIGEGPLYLLGSPILLFFLLLPSFNQLLTPLPSSASSGLAVIIPFQVSFTNPAQVSSTNPAQVSSTNPAQVSSTIPAQVSSTIPAQVSSTIPAGSTVPYGSTTTSSTPSHNSRIGAIAGGIAREEAGGADDGVDTAQPGSLGEYEAGTRLGLGGDANEKADGVVGAKEDDGMGGKLAASIDGELVTPFMAGVGAATYAADPTHQQQHQYYADPQGQGQQAYYGNGVGAHETATSEGALSTATGSYYPHSGTLPAPTADCGPGPMRASSASSSRGCPNPMTAQEREARGVG